MFQRKIQKKKKISRVMWVLQVQWNLGIVADYLTLTGKLYIVISIGSLCYSVFPHFEQLKISCQTLCRSSHSSPFWSLKQASEFCHRCTSCLKLYFYWFRPLWKAFVLLPTFWWEIFQGSICLLFSSVFILQHLAFSFPFQHLQTLTVSTHGSFTVWLSLGFDIILLTLWVSYSACRLTYIEDRKYFSKEGWQK